MSRVRDILTDGNMHFGTELESRQKKRIIDLIFMVDFFRTFQVYKSIVKKVQRVSIKPLRL